MREYKSPAYTSELMEDFCEEEGFDKKLLEKMYYYFIEALTRSARYDPTKISYIIRGFGVIYFTLIGCLHEKNNKKEILNKKDVRDKERVQKGLEKFETFEKTIRNRIAELKAIGVKNILFLRRRFNKTFIKNV